ncbi:MAG: Alcohol dehydrogenase zinc-binding domain protein [Pedosphaera sp.]|nr:Alcohol dehydrogenase zinc-binding domain protein [Pedosphaera sp.]
MLGRLSGHKKAGKGNQLRNFLMKAMYLNRKAGAESLILGEIPQPLPRTGEVLVKVHATAVTPTELQWYPTFNTQSGEPRPFPIVLSHEFSAVVASIGPGVQDVKAGEAVYGINDWFSNGAQAEYCITPANSLARKPQSLDHIQAAVVPISALTAWQGLFERASLEPGQRVLIHGAAGGVGTFAVQLARRRGASVAATASSANLDFVRSLGADQVIDYRTTRFEDAVRDMDAVFDGVGGETLERSWGVLKDGGKLVTVAAQSEGAAGQRVRDAFMLVRADATQLAEIANLIDAGELRVFMAGEFPLAEARAAYERAGRSHMHGKLALRVAG